MDLAIKARMLKEAGWKTNVAVGVAGVAGVAGAALLHNAHKSSKRIADHMDPHARLHAKFTMMGDSNKNPSMHHEANRLRANASEIYKKHTSKEIPLKKHSVSHTMSARDHSFVANAHAFHGRDSKGAERSLHHEAHKYHVQKHKELGGTDYR